MEAILLSIRHRLAQLIWAAVFSLSPLCFIACDEADPTDHGDEDVRVDESTERPTCPDDQVGSKQDGVMICRDPVLDADAGLEPSNPCEGIEMLLEDHPNWFCPWYGSNGAVFTFRPEMGDDNMCHPVLNLNSTGRYPTDYTVQRHSHGFSIVIRDELQGTEPLSCCPEDQTVCPEPPSS